MIIILEQMEDLEEAVVAELDQDLEVLVILPQQIHLKEMMVVQVVQAYHNQVLVVEEELVVQVLARQEDIQVEQEVQAYLI